MLASVDIAVLQYIISLCSQHRETYIQEKKTTNNKLNRVVVDSLQNEMCAAVLFSLITAISSAITGSFFSNCTDSSLAFKVPTSSSSRSSRSEVITDGGVEQKTANIRAVSLRQTKITDSSD